VVFTSAKTGEFSLPAKELETLVLGNSKRSHVVCKRPDHQNAHVSQSQR